MNKLWIVFQCNYSTQVVIICTNNVLFKSVPHLLTTWKKRDGLFCFVWLLGIYIELRYFNQSLSIRRTQLSEHHHPVQNFRYSGINNWPTTITDLNMIRPRILSIQPIIHIWSNRSPQTIPYAECWIKLKLILSDQFQSSVTVLQLIWKTKLIIVKWMYADTLFLLVN